MPSSSPPLKQQPGLPLSVGQLGMVLLLASISVLFFASCVAVLITFHQGSFPGEAAQADAVSRLTMPWGVVGSTLVLAAVGACLQTGLQLQRNRAKVAASIRWLRNGGILAVTFVAIQGLNCAQLLQAASSSARDALFLFAFNLLIGLHAAHVLGGLIYLGICLSRLQSAASSVKSTTSLQYCVHYWHYLGVVWIPLVATLLWVQ